MVLVDTSVWVEHLRPGDLGLKARLQEGQVWCHPFLMGGLAGGNLQNCSLIFSYPLPGAGASGPASRNAATVRLRPSASPT